MPELRKDPVVDRWVIIAKNRAERPQELAATAVSRASDAPCPFCEGHEDDTTPEIAAVRAAGTRPNSPGWQVRVVPNKFPALVPGPRAVAGTGGFFQTLPAVGAHEVIIESPRHLRSTSELADDELAEVFWIYRDRLLQLRQEIPFAHPTIFKNVGEAAGASIEHLHSQLTAVPIVPFEAARALAGAEQFYRSRGKCVYCAMLEEELAAGERIVGQIAGEGGFVAFCPFAARAPFETWIVPTAHFSHFEQLSRDSARHLARIMKDVLARIELSLDQPAYNYIIHTGSFDTLRLDHYHWHIEIIPRVTKAAGFELGTGFTINPVPPEEAAALMRSYQVAG